jgi:predicted Zn finger-like uncharacterized protein
MLIVCPSCASTYTIEAELLGQEGRRVRCAACRREWFVDRADPVAAPAIAAFEAVVADFDAPKGVPPAGDPPSGVEAPLPADAANPAGDWPGDTRLPPPLPRKAAATARTRPGRIRPPRNMARMAAAAILVFVVGTLGFARDFVVRLLPGTANLYAAVGAPVNLRGLAFRAVRPELVAEGDNRTLVVEGEILNVTRKAQDVPPIAVAIRSKSGQPLYGWTVDPPRQRLEAGETLAFRSRLATPPADGHDVFVRFRAANERVAGMPQVQ